jgi:hypothetical protein
MPIKVDLRSIKDEFMFIIKQVKDQRFQSGFIFFYHGLHNLYSFLRNSDNALSFGFAVKYC